MSVIIHISQTDGKVCEWMDEKTGVMKATKKHINPIQLKDEEWRGLSMAQRTKEMGNCVEVFKDPDQIVMATTGIQLFCFVFESTQSSWVHLFIGIVDGEGMLFCGKLLGTFRMILNMV